MKSELFSVILALIVISPVMPVSAQSAPSAEIVNVEYPSEVVAGQSFTVNVRVRYSYQGWTFADLGVFEDNFTKIFDYVHYYLTNETTKSFALTVMAPSASTDLHLMIVTRYWYQNFWMMSPNGSKDIYVKVVGPAQSQTSEFPSVVKINENEWYYWRKNGSDACVILLSGGLAYSDHVTLNPYEMETFGAMKYINDLSRLYSVLAPRKGTESQTIPYSTQTFYALGYYPGSIFLKQVYDWGRGKGYNFTYLVGYSTGGAAAGYEVTVRDPETWASPNGAVIISAPLNGVPPTSLFESVTHAKGLKADIQLIYGKIWSEELWPQGKQFYDNAPEKTSVPWYRKEWHLISDSSHEVWVKEEDGAHYNSGAYNLTSQFIEKNKSPWHRLSEWNDASMEIYDVTASSGTGEQKPKTPGISFVTKVGNTLKVKVWLYNCSSPVTCARATVDYIKVDLYSSEGYIDTHYTNVDGYEEFVFTVPAAWENKTVKIFATIGGEYRGLYSPTIILTINSKSG
jgi:hypothetical protein